MSSTPDPELIDELASRLLDGDIAVADIEPALLDPVLARRAVFAANRDRLRHETPLIASPDVRIPAVGASRTRSIGYTVAGLAAAAVVGLIGVAIGSSRDSSETSFDSSANDESRTAESFAAVTAAPEAALPMTAAELPPAAADTGLATTGTSATPAVCPDPVGRALIYTGVYDGEAVEVHFSDTDGLVVYRLTDCAVVLGIVP